MAVAVPASTWRALARRLADELDGDGDLRTPQWRDALLAVPRHEFVPRYYVPEPDARPLRWITHEPRDAESTQLCLLSLGRGSSSYGPVGWRWPTSRDRWGPGT